MAAERGSTSRHAAIALSGQWGRYLLQIVALVVFSRLLSPSDFGLVAMVTAVVGVAYIVGDFGLSLAAVRAPNLTAAQKNNLFWLNSAIGLLVAGGVAAAAVPLSLLYGDPRVAPITLALAAVFALNGFGVQFRTELNRDLRFSAIALSDVVGQAAGLIAGLVVVWLGGSYWALVAMQIIAAVITNTLSAASARWWPGWYRRGEPMRSLVAFGINTLATQVVNYISTNIDQVLVGRVWGATSLGFYNRAFQIARMPAQQVAAPLTRVILPHLARRLDDPAAYLAAVRRAQLALSASLLSVLGAAAATADPLVDLALGPGWSEVVPILRALCLAGALQAVGYITYWVLLSKDRTGLLFGTELTARIVMIALMVVVVAWGPVWVALAAAAGQLLILVSAALWALPRVGLTARSVFGPALRPALVAGFATTVTWGLSRLTEGMPSIVALVLLLPLFALSGAVCTLIPAVRRDARELIDTVDRVRHRRRVA